MIFSISLNSCIDYVSFVDQFQRGSSHKAIEDLFYPGGKGINVARILNALDSPIELLGFVGGFTGVFIENSLVHEGITTNFVHTTDRSRVNIKIKDQTESEIDGVTSKLSDLEIDRFFASLDEIKSGDMVLLCGSLPTCIPDDFYAKIMEKIGSETIDCVVDTTGNKLKQTFRFKPFLIKPNLKELEELFDTTIETIDEVIHYGKIIQAEGVKNIVVSLAGDGALLFTENRVYIALVPSIEVKNSVGAGDSLIAGMVNKIRFGESIIKSFHYGVAVSVASAASKGLVDIEKIAYYFDKISIREI